MSGVDRSRHLLIGGANTVTSPSSQIIPYGYCHCGCGKKTTLATHTSKKGGRQKGLPCPYLRAHGPRKPNLLTPTVAVPFKIEGVYCRLIPLTKGMYAIVWEEDYYRLSVHKWHARWNQKTRSFYAVRGATSLKGKPYSIFMHRKLLGLEKDDKRQGDHENLDTLDNRRSNLRVATNRQNTCNQRRRSDNTSGYKGVSFHSQAKKWRAVIVTNGKHKSLGLFVSKEMAYAAYCAAAMKDHKEFTRLA